MLLGLSFTNKQYPAMVQVQGNRKPFRKVKCFPQTGTIRTIVNVVNQNRSIIVNTLGQCFRMKERFVRAGQINEIKRGDIKCQIHIVLSDGFFEITVKGVQQKPPGIKIGNRFQHHPGSFVLCRSCTPDKALTYIGVYKRGVQPVSSLREEEKPDIGKRWDHIGISSDVPSSRIVDKSNHRSVFFMICSVTRPISMESRSISGPESSVSVKRCSMAVF